MSDCPRFGKWLKGCRFEARYDKGAPKVEFELNGRGSAREILQACKPTTYVKDVCITCGKTVMRDEQA